MAVSDVYFTSDLSVSREISVSSGNAPSTLGISLLQFFLRNAWANSKQGERLGDLGGHVKLVKR